MRDIEYERMVARRKMAKRVPCNCCNSMYGFINDHLDPNDVIGAYRSQGRRDWSDAEELVDAWIDCDFLTRSQVETYDITYYVYRMLVQGTEDDPLAD